ncbi:MAG TPA: hypothetical protein DEO40_02320 [Treponema sp.]|nr:hypothetical protein [Treponema sp.]HBB43148.1 hypothetical protein [Treponema sp.]HCA19495.1 hypothetical protein [Treponema sp.]
MLRGNAYNEERKQRRKSKFLPRLLLTIGIAGVLTCIAIFSYRFFTNKFHSANTVPMLYEQWDNQDFQGVYDTSAAILEKNFLQNAARTFHGYSAFLLAVSETDNAVAQDLLDEAIINLRIAMQYAKEDVLPQIKYMLGRSYFHKDSSAGTHFYADLAIKYLLECQAEDFHADDIPEYLGLSYAALGETQKSIESFTEALLVHESDTLLLSIAEQYCNASQGGTAKQYLKRVQNITQNDEVLLKSHFLLAQIYMDESDNESAQKEFETILEKNTNSADAHYGLGVLYEKQGDMAKARSEWRKCLTLQPMHIGARQKMSDNK